MLNFTYGYTLAKVLADRTHSPARCWTAGRFTASPFIQSGQPYSVIDYSGAVGSIYYSTFDGIINPIVPLAPGCTRKNALTGDNGAFYNVNTGAGAALKATCFHIPLIQPGTMGVPNGDDFETNFTTGERNIFRQSWQKRADASLDKELPIHEQCGIALYLRCLQPHQHCQLRHSAEQRESESGFQQRACRGRLYNGRAAHRMLARRVPCPGGLYNCPSGLGITKHTIGSPRQIQMSLHLDF